MLSLKCAPILHNIWVSSQAKFFRSFEKLRELRSAGIVGTGLELTVCERLIEAHGGRVWVE